MKKIILSILILTSALLAEDINIEKYYVGIGGTINETYTDAGRDQLGHSVGEFSNVGGSIITGVILSKNDKINYGVEARIGKSLIMEDSEDIETTHAGIYAMGNYQPYKILSLYAGIGGSVVDFQGDNIGESFGGVSGIAGIALVNADESLYFFTDYTMRKIDANIKYFDKDVNFDTITLGVRYAF